jgi:hypothetical protein
MDDENGQDCRADEKWHSEPWADQQGGFNVCYS